jgi:hypothetical protein
MPTPTLRTLLLAASFAGVVFAGASMGGACATDSATLREFIAPDFSNVDDTRLQDAMWRLGGGVQQLHDTLRADAALADADRKARVLAILDVMAEAAVSVDKPGQKQRHKNVAMNIDQLKADIAAAKAAAEAGDLALAQALPQTCLACHTGGAGGPQQGR